MSKLFSCLLFLLFDFAIFFMVAVLCVWGLKTAFKFNEYFWWVFFFVLPFQEKDFHVSMSLDPCRWTILWYWSFLRMFWSSSQDSARDLNFWKACRGFVAPQSIVSDDRDPFVAIVCGVPIYKWCCNDNKVRVSAWWVDWLAMMQKCSKWLTLLCLYSCAVVLMSMT